MQDRSNTMLSSSAGHDTRVAFACARRTAPARTTSLPGANPAVSEAKTEAPTSPTMKELCCSTGAVLQLSVWAAIEPPQDGNGQRPAAGRHHHHHERGCAARALPETTGSASAQPAISTARDPPSLRLMGSASQALNPRSRRTADTAVDLHQHCTCVMGTRPVSQAASGGARVDDRRGSC